ncbi:MAG: hypothetical protein ABSC04_21535 [Syntrophobacteraceae bacterium]
MPTAIRVLQGEFSPDRANTFTGEIDASKNFGKFIQMDAGRINKGSRVIAVADIFTAMAEDRPYRNAMRKSDIMSVLNSLSCKNHLDKHVVSVLESNYDAVIASTVHKQNEARESYLRKFQINEN